MHPILLARVALVVLLGGCALRPSAIPAGALPARDQDTLRFEQPVRIAVVGSGSERAVVDDIAGWDPDLVLILGDMVPRSTTRSWEGVHERWAPLSGRVLPVAGAGERRGDRALRGMAAAFPGIGVRELDGAFWQVDLVHGDVRWRLVLLDVLLPEFQDQLFWVPKVVTGEGYDRLVLAAGAPLEEELARLLDTVHDHADPAALMAVLAGGTEAVELALPDGRYGPVHLAAGPASLGWWPLVIDGHELELVYRELRPDGFRETTRIRATAAEGWVRSQD